MINPTNEDIGRKVIYRSFGGDVIEEGVITSFSESWVFVRYGSNTQSAGTHRSNLEYSFRTTEETSILEFTVNGIRRKEFIKPFGPDQMEELQLEIKRKTDAYLQEQGTDS